MRILGLDVCKDSVVGWLLTEGIPRNFKRHFQEHKRKDTKDNPDPMRFRANVKGIDELLKLNPDVVAMEPTGVHYARIWTTVFKHHNIEILWIGHAEVRHYRQQNKLPDKNDQADALALACYACLHMGQDDFFLNFQPFPVDRLREIWLQTQSVNRIQSPIINRIRQQLAHEFPEVALNRTQERNDGTYPLWQWLSGQQGDNKYYNRIYDKSVAKLYGIEISSFTKELASMLCKVHDWEYNLTNEMSEHLSNPVFKNYMEILHEFGIGAKPAALLLSQIYPISQFDNVARFKRRLGMGKVEDSSGDVEASKQGAGSKFCRTQLYLWILDRIAPVKARPATIIGAKLGEFYDLRSSQFQDNPEIWKAKHMEKFQKAKIAELRRSLNTEMTKLLPKDASPQLETTLNLVFSMFEMNIAGLTPLAPEVKTTEAKRGFGNLIIMQTAAYGCRLLFRELKKAI